MFLYLMKEIFSFLINMPIVQEWNQSLLKEEAIPPLYSVLNWPCKVSRCVPCQLYSRLVINSHCPSANKLVCGWTYLCPHRCLGMGLFCDPMTVVSALFSAELQFNFPLQRIKILFWTFCSRIVICTVLLRINFHLMIKAFIWW